MSKFHGMYYNRFLTLANAFLKWAHKGVFNLGGGKDVYMVLESG